MAAGTSNDLQADRNSPDPRLVTLAGLEILDTPPEPEFDTITRTAQHLLDC